MAEAGMYLPEHTGDWGRPTTLPGGAYGTTWLTAPDGVRLFSRFWRAPEAQAPVLVLLHGLGAHSGWFIDMGNALHAQGLSVYIPDHRGFGRSEGPRGHVTAASVFMRDTQMLLDAVRQQHPQAGIALLGHSMGALFALHLAAADARAATPRLATLLLLNPWIADTGRQPAAVLLRLVAGGLVGSARLYRVAGGPDVMTTNPEAVRMLDADSYWVRQQSAAFLLQVTRLRTAALRRAREVRVPTLVLQSEGDLAIVPAASKRCFEALGCATKRYSVYPGYAHDAEFEADRAALDTEIAGWVRQHCG